MFLQNSLWYRALGPGIDEICSTIAVDVVVHGNWSVHRQAEVCFVGRAHQIIP